MTDIWVIGKYWHKENFVLDTAITTSYMHNHNVTGSRTYVDTTKYNNIDSMLFLEDELIIHLIHDKTWGWKRRRRMNRSRRRFFWPWRRSKTFRRERADKWRRSDRWWKPTSAKSRGAASAKPKRGRTGTESGKSPGVDRWSTGWGRGKWGSGSVFNVKAPWPI